VSRRVVLDTNVVLSALLFSTGRLVWMRTAWQQGRLLPLASKATLDELIRVLSYPKFALSGDDVLAILKDYVPYVETVEVPAGPLDGVPCAPDPDDQKFLDLAVSGGASDLVTGDAGLLTVSPPPGLTIVTPEAFRGVMAV
jgi:putative PIN family toxin of toxin-antitoxin system